jgi:hypothetical protein
MLFEISIIETWIKIIYQYTEQKNRIIYQYIEQ